MDAEVNGLVPISAKGLIHDLMGLAAKGPARYGESFIAYNILLGMAAGTITHGSDMVGRVIAGALGRTGVTPDERVVAQHAAQMGLFTSGQPFALAQQVEVANTAVPDPAPAPEPAHTSPGQCGPSNMVTSAKTEKAAPRREGDGDISDERPR